MLQHARRSGEVGGFHVSSGRTRMGSPWALLTMVKLTVRDDDGDEGSSAADATGMLRVVRIAKVSPRRAL